jgi:prepilin-type N-terminal cleavage/methylation domain-containing protein
MTTGKARPVRPGAGRRRSLRAKRASGFTLIEIMAVILIIGLMSTLLLPAFGAGGGAKLRGQAERVAGFLELARQRAVVTGKPHRVVLDLENGGYSIEWLVTGGSSTEPSEVAGIAPGLGGGPIDLSPPREELAAYQPIPNRFGGRDWLEPGIFFEGVDTPEGWIEQGEVALVFGWDGSSDAAQIVISDPDSRSFDLDIAPLLEIVRIHEETD